MNKIKDYFENEIFQETNARKLRKRINTLEIENETLKNTIKDKLYEEFMKKLGEPMENSRLRKENRKLRKQNKELKEIIKEDNRRKK